jgi:hypothetical protein
MTAAELLLAIWEGDADEAPGILARALADERNRALEEALGFPCTDMAPSTILRVGEFIRALKTDPPNWREQESECAPESQPLP